MPWTDPVKRAVGYVIKKIEDWDVIVDDLLYLKGKGGTKVTIENSLEVNPGTLEAKTNTLNQVGLYIARIATAGSLRIVPNAGSGAYNDLTGSNDVVIFTGDNVNQDIGLTLTQWSSIRRGIRIGPDGTIYKLNHIATIRTTTAVASVTFSNPPSGYAHYFLYFKTGSDYPVDIAFLHLRLNNDAGSNYRTRTTVSSDSTPSTSLSSGTAAFIGYIVGANRRDSGFNFSEGHIHIQHIKESTFRTIIANSTMYLGGASPTIWQTHTASHWFLVQGISSITLFPSAGNFVTSSTFTLYGVPDES